MKSHSHVVLSIEGLESRLTPAITIINGTTATFTDVDGDSATVKVSTGILSAGLFTSVAAGSGNQLQEINLSAGGFDGANLVITDKKSATGDGLVNVGYINSTGHNLGAVSVAGDLGQIDAGSDDTVVAAVKSLAVRSLGRFGTDTQAAGGDIQTNLNGRLGSLVVSGDIDGAFVNIVGFHGSIGSVTIGGSLIGGTTSSSGSISCINTGDVKIGHDVRGGAGASSGGIFAVQRISNVSIAGSLFVGPGSGSGQIEGELGIGIVRIGHDFVGGKVFTLSAPQITGNIAGVTIGGSMIGGSIVSFGDVGPIKIGHDILGSSVTGSGLISAGGKLAGIAVGGSLVGGSNHNTGVIHSGGDMGAVQIGQDLIGASIGAGDGPLDESGYIESLARIASVSIGGSIISGTNTSTSPVKPLTRNASIRAGDDIGSLTVKGGLVGNQVGIPSAVIISARGQAFPVPTRNVAIGKLAIGGSVEFAQILAGYAVDLTPKNADAQIGAVTVGRDWIASNLAAGVVDGGNGFGTAPDFKISGAGTTDTAGIVSKITSITIKGQAIGTPNSQSSTDHFGFVAQQIGTLKVGALSFGLKSGAANDMTAIAVGLTGDLSALEVAL